MPPGAERLKLPTDVLANSSPALVLILKRTGIPPVLKHMARYVTTFVCVRVGMKGKTLAK